MSTAKKLIHSISIHVNPSVFFQSSPETPSPKTDTSKLLAPPVSVHYVRAPTPDSIIPDQAIEEWGPTSHPEATWKSSKFSPTCRACSSYQKWRAATKNAVDNISREAKHPASSKAKHAFASLIRHKWTEEDSEDLRFFHEIQLLEDSALERKDFEAYRRHEHILADYKEEQIRKRMEAVIEEGKRRWIRRERWERMKLRVVMGVENTVALFRREKEEKIVIRR